MNPLPEYPASINPSVLRAAKDALALVRANLPYLSGLVHTVRLQVDARVETAGVFESGRLLIHPEWFLGLKAGDRMFVLAHELMHLALRSHQRSHSPVFNLAHDYIINDMLTVELDYPVPAGGLEWPGASQMSAEKVADLITRKQAQGHTIPCSMQPSSVLSDVLVKAGLISKPATKTGISHDVLDDGLEHQWFPQDAGSTANQKAKILKAIAESVSVKLLQDRSQKIWDWGSNLSQRATVCVDVLQGLYRPPWEAALQRWMEAVTCGTRSFARPSRRGAERLDIVLPGRQREGWMLHLILDTSGSMGGVFAQVMENIASFCASTNVQCVHIIQCDCGIAREEDIFPDQLTQYEICGLGGSDLSMAMRKLASDPGVEAAIVITDGCICYPDEAMPYEVLWVLTSHNNDFCPNYGQKIQLVGD